MNANHSTLRVLGAGFAAFALTAMTTGPAAAAEGDVDVVNTETVQVYMSPEGEIESQRVYEQLTLTGTGAAEVANPIEEQGLRNLDGFSGFSVEDGVQNVEVDVDGVQRLRSVSDFSGDLPLDISIEYRLDGSLVEPSDVVGADGELEVLFTVRNVTAQTQEVTFTDGRGGTMTEMAEVPIPMVGSLTTTAPSNFSEVTSGQANMAGDGKGGTKLTFTMTLFPPLGSDEISFGYTANVTDGVVPSSTVSALPVNPLESTSFKAAGESYQAGSDTGIRLAEGATEIDTNLLKLRDGAADLLSGLMQLSDGADQLNAGLAGEAAPGAVQLADGAVALRDGLGQIDAGAGELADGAGELSGGATRLRDGAGDLSAGAGQLDDGAGKLAAGASDLADGTGSALSGSEQLESGLGSIRDGLDQLAGVEGLQAAVGGTQQLRAGVDQLLAGFGSVETPGTLLFGLHSLETGLTQLEAGSGNLVVGLTTLRGDGSAETPGLVAAKGGVDQVQGGLAAAVADGGSLDQLIGGLEQLQPLCGLPGAPGHCNQSFQDLINGAKASKSNLTAANEGLLQVSGGLNSAITALTDQLIPGAQQLNGGLAQAKAGATQVKSGALALKAGTQEVAGGLAQLEAGLVAALGGANQLLDGANLAYAGSGDLTDGLGLIDAGAGKLAAGAGELSDGTARLRAGAVKLADGSVLLADGSVRLADGTVQLAAGTGEASDGSQQLADGAGRLADGLGDAAEGSGRLADGLEQAAEGAPKLVDGAGRLSEEGMSQLIAAGEDTAQDYGKLYAVIEAGAERADAEKMAYGAPENAQGLTAYTYELLGDDGSGSRNTQRGLGALALLGLGGGAFALRRRFI